jgi:hypothetical protein
LADAVSNILAATRPPSLFRELNGGFEAALNVDSNFTSAKSIWRDKSKAMTKLTELIDRLCAGIWQRGRLTGFSAIGVSR